jgi:tetratricopeptide (TPR) repeat protein
MRRRALLLAAATVGCAGADRHSLPFARAALGVARLAHSLKAGDERWCLEELERMSALARAIKHDNPSLSATSLLRKLVFDTLGFVREVTDTDLAFVLLPGVLKARRGSCVGLASVYLTLAEQLGVAAHGVLMPGHFYVRLEQGGRVENVELLRRGESMPDNWHGNRFPIPGGGAVEYGRPLTLPETMGVIHYNLGNERRRQLRLSEAREAYARAVGHFPDLAEAHASLGAIQHLLGQLDQAANSYRMARRANPHLPGVDQNISLLERERGN